MSEFQIPGFRIEGLIREGSTATSWKAVQTSLNREVVIKTLNTDGTEEDRVKLDIVLEQMRKVASLKHRGIIEVIDVGVQDGIYYVVTCQAGGFTASELLRTQSPLDEKDILSIAEDVAGALDHAWTQKHLFHGNIKPDNVVVRADGAAISDMGLVRKGPIYNQSTGETRETVVGTPNFMSPEQVQCAEFLDCRTDIYSLGATLYHLATGQLPFGDAPGEAAMFRHLTDWLPNPRDINPEISQGLAYLIAKMMVKNPANRALSWEEVINDIKRIRTSRVVVQKYDDLGLSTVRPPKGAEAVKRPSAPLRREKPQKKPASGLRLALAVLRLLLVIGLWAVLAVYLLKQPAID